MPKVEEDPIILGMEDDVDVHEVDPVVVDVHIPLTEFNVRLKPQSPCQTEPDMAIHGQPILAPEVASRNRRDQRPSAPIKTPSHHPGEATIKVTKSIKGPPLDRSRGQLTTGTKGDRPNASKYTHQEYGKSEQSTVTAPSGTQVTAYLNCNPQEMGICIKCKRKKAAVMCTCGQVKICRDCSTACHDCGLVMDKMQQEKC